MFSLSRSRPAFARQAGFGLVARIARGLELRRSRAALAKLDKHLLEDIGLDQVTAEREIHRFL